MTDSLRSTLHSFVNSYQSVMWRLRECPLNDEQLGMAVGVSGNAIRNRRAKPDLWKLSDVERLAGYFSLPATACVQLNRLLRELPGQLKTVPADERRRIERQLVIKATQFEAFNQTDWPVRHLLRMHRSLSNATR